MVQLRKAMAMTVPVGASTTITVLVGALLPGPVGFTVFVGGLAVAAVLALGIREDLAAAVLLRARPLTPGEEAALAPAVTLLCRSGCGPPLIRLRVRPQRAEVAASGAGRSTVVLSGGLVAAVRDGVLPVEEAAAVIAHAASLVRAGLTRMDLFLGFWTIPWRLLHGLAEGVAAVFGRLPGVRLVWRVRALVSGIAVVQMCSQGHWPIAAVITAVTALSYATSSWRHRWETQLRRTGDALVRDAGFGPALARFLRRLPRTPALRDRIADLDHNLQAPQSLGLVTRL